MLKQFSVSLFVLLFVTTAFGQPVVDIPLSASDGSATIQLAVGLDLTATPGIDPALGESDLPPFPPAGVFEIRFDLSPYAGEPLSSYKDYRNAPSFPYTDTVEHRLIWQRCEAGLPVDIQYNIPLNANMVIQDEFGGVLLNLGPFTGTGTATIPGALPLTAALVFMGYTDIVPVELSSFTATASNQEVLLNWTTATELNNQGFEIERSTANQSWEKIGYVPGFGTTSEPRSYSFRDENVVAGSYSYRLKQIDFDGTFSYSDEVVVEVDFTPSEYNLYQNFPNPFNPSTKIEFQVPSASDVSIIIYDMLGQEIKSLFNEQVVPGRYTLEWDGSNSFGTQMSSGIYIYRMTAGSFVEAREMILIK
jgi:hypothetical protein